MSIIEARRCAELAGFFDQFYIVIVAAHPLLLTYKCNETAKRDAVFWAFSRI